MPSPQGRSFLSQEEVIAFLSNPQSYDDAADEVLRIKTHGAEVFLAGHLALKIKRDVAFEYMDFSTLALRRAALERELCVNRPHAPDLYIDVVAITRGGKGRLHFGGSGQVVEYALRMRRFDQSDLASEMAVLDLIDTELCLRLADAISDYHNAAPSHIGLSWGQGAVGTIIDELAHALVDDRINEKTQSRFLAACRCHLARASVTLDNRALSGSVRRCHGDLHLRNIVVLAGAPVLFDALEFDERLATIDVLYDLAFLLMDLDVLGQRANANRIFNRYLWRSGQFSDLAGLQAMPLFLALRAGIRAMVALQRDQDGGLAEASRYLAAGEDYLSAPAPRLIAVGGFSGTGKSTLAAALAPTIGGAPGALHLRSDLERKALFGVAETVRLPGESYSQAASDRVYRLLFDKASIALAAGQSVIVDAVFSKPSERAAIERLATDQAHRFDGVWLTADRDTLVGRVESRTGDASDATSSVVMDQLGRGAGEITWHQIDAGGTAEDTLAKAAVVVGERRD